ncbi:2'-5' RNA ligase [Kineosphaera limosa]|uniref:RNA 2',3'-cyclic phosphodiesterase n=1 Tax=Kineosphaera limosa NBRC 100340 TaxID=1184609 RepID=K6W7Q6_9MICO|nr:RNA 2',3'-cyclic phosphodiesterase [Kineosphaera limosa]NYE01480.1 2'-5' RNA ligase [Kineosphaera limosa]GAB95225.1 2'-5' RNA ligase [Kineosphaera limosa NBRC 100340]
MRAFVALFPPADVVEHLGEFLAPRRAARGPQAGAIVPRWTRDEHLHLTLAFLPDLADRDLEELADRLAQAAAKRPLDLLRLAGGGAFPDPIDARVLWVGVQPESGHEQLARLAGSVRSAANSAGALVSGGAFTAHVTVARLARATRATRWLRVLQAYDGPDWQPEHLTLVRSHLGQGPHRTPRYEELGTFALGE